MPQTMGKIQDFMWRFGVAVFLLLLIMNVLSLQANMAKPVRLNDRIFFPALAAFFGYVIWWTIVFFRAFRIPGQRNANHQLHDTACRRP